ncbi:hypothetical protein [Streptomyces sp. NPDC088789]|uniref:hypothetical protein n=1 Tax=Streptomyces sp. NPDC088789 TaxID=3365899 RepID=UPI0038136ED1
MPKRPHSGRSRTSRGLPDLESIPADLPAVEPASDPLAYAAFCHEHWTVYWRFGSAVAGSPRRGHELARAALREVAAHWMAILGSASCDAAAWDLLSRTCAARRTEPVGRLHRVLGRREADALVLRHKVGLTARQASRVMGLSEADFGLLYSRALLGLNA